MTAQLDRAFRAFALEYRRCAQAGTVRLARSVAGYCVEDEREQPLFRSEGLSPREMERALTFAANVLFELRQERERGAFRRADRVGRLLQRVRRRDGRPLRARARRCRMTPAYSLLCNASTTDRGLIAPVIERYPAHLIDLVAVIARIMGEPIGKAAV